MWGRLCHDPDFCIDFSYYDDGGCVVEHDIGLAFTSIMNGHTEAQVRTSLRPDEAAVALQVWSQLGFFHWRVDSSRLAALLPSGLAVDTYDGDAFIGIVPFHTSRSRPRGLPPLPGFSRFDEVNLRTYVHHRETEPGVYFFSLDANNLGAVLGGRTVYRLPYFRAQIAFHFARSSKTFSSKRRGRNADFAATYEPTTEPRESTPGTLEYFLAERYVLYANAGGRLYRARVHHRPYPLQEATGAVVSESLCAAAGIEKLDQRPLVHYAEQVDVEIFRLRRVV